MQKLLFLFRQICCYRVQATWTDESTVHVHYALTRREAYSWASQYPRDCEVILHRNFAFVARRRAVAIGV